MSEDMRVTPLKALPAAPIKRKRTQIIEEQIGADTDSELSEDQQRLARLFERLGGGGKVKIFRVVNGTPLYSATQPITEDFSANLEERLAGLCGGGEFVLKGFIDNGKKCVGEASIHIDERLFPAKQTNREAERQGGQAGAPYDHAKQLESQERLYRLQLDQQAAQSEREGQWMRAFMQQQQAASDRALLMQQQFMQSQMELTVRLTAAQHGNTAAVAGGSDMDRMKGYLGFFKELGFGQQSEARTMGERILTVPLERLADRVGEKAIDAFFPKEEPAKPAAQIATPKPAAAPPSATTSTPAPAPQAKTTPPTGTPTPFPRSELLTPEEFRRRKDAARSKSTSTQPPAPPAKEVLGKEPPK